MSEFGQRVRHARQQAGLSQHDLATKLGYASRQTVSFMESGHSSPGIDTVMEIARALGVSAHQLLDLPIDDDERFAAGFDAGYSSAMTDIQILIGEARQKGRRP